MTTITTTPADFDHADLLNEDGTVTFRMIPSNWHVANVSPDTYQSFTGDGWVEMELAHFSDEGDLSAFGEEYAFADGHAIDYDYYDFTWDYNHKGIVEGLSEELMIWIAEVMDEAGLKSAWGTMRLHDTWSPAFYNFTTDGFEVEITCDPDELRALTPDFDVDQWAHDHYGHAPGFMSYVTSRMSDPKWRAGYDAEFRVEYLLSQQPDVIERDWVMRLAEAEDEVYRENVTMKPNVERIREKIEYMESGLTLTELEAWAQEHMDVYRAGMDPIEGVDL